MEARLEILISCLGCESWLLQTKGFISSSKGLTGNDCESCSSPEDKLVRARRPHSVSAQYKNTWLCQILLLSKLTRGVLHTFRLLLGDSLLKTILWKMLPSMFLNNKIQIMNSLSSHLPIFLSQTEACYFHA